MIEPVIKEKLKIEEFLNKYFMINGDYTISDNGVVDVNGDVYLLYPEKFNQDGFTELPIQFGYIKGDFVFKNSNIKTLKGFPYTVRNYCEIYGSKYLKSLEYSPKCKNIFCDDCINLQSLSKKHTAESSVLSKKCTDGISTLDGLNCEFFSGLNINLKKFGTNFYAKEFRFDNFPIPTSDEMRHFIQLNPILNTNQKAPWITLINDYFEHKDLFIAIGEFEALYNEPWEKPEDRIEIINSDVTMDI